MATDTNPRRYATNADWEMHRSIIIDLYVTQNLSLEHVVKIMAQEHNFVATLSMYKKRITKWGLRKNLSKKEVAAMLSLQQARKIAGKQTDFFVGQRKVDIGKYRRRHESFLSPTSTPAPSDMAESDIIVRTPSPDLMVLKAPTTLQLPEETFHIVRDYACGSFEAGRWLYTYNSNFSVASGHDQSDFALTSARRIFSLVKRVLENEPQDTTAAFVLLRSAFDNLPQILRNESPTLILFLLELCEHLNDKSDLALTTRHRLCQLCETTLGSRHPLVQILKGVLQSEASNERAIISAIHDILLDVITPVVGPDNLLAIQLYLACIWHSEGLKGFVKEQPHPVIQRHMMNGKAPVAFHGSKCALALDLCYPSLQSGRPIDAEQYLLTMSNTIHLLGALVDYSQAFSGVLIASMKLNQGFRDEACALCKDTKEISQKWAWDRALSQCINVYAEALSQPQRRMSSMMSLSAIMDPPEATHVVQEIDTPMSASSIQFRPKYEIAIVCALQIEVDAVLDVMDKFLDHDEESNETTNPSGEACMFYTGIIEGHSIVLTHLKALISIGSTAVTALIQARFPDIKLVLAVGVCGGTANTNLGDVVLSTTVVRYRYNGHEGIDIQSANTLDGRLDHSQPYPILNAMLPILKNSTMHQKLQDDIVGLLRTLQNKMPDTRYPGEEKDWLYDTSYLHKHVNDQSTTQCEICNSDHDRVCKAALMMDCDRLGCDHTRRVSRIQAKSSKNSGERHYPKIHFARIASGNRALRSGQERDYMVKMMDVLAFEMESANLTETFPTIVIKGVCDYADGHKMKAWRKYAAITAAAAMKVLLRNWNVEESSKN